MFLVRSFFISCGWGAATRPIIPNFTRTSRLKISRLPRFILLLGVLLLGYAASGCRAQKKPAAPAEMDGLLPTAANAVNGKDFDCAETADGWRTGAGSGMGERHCEHEMAGRLSPAARRRLLPVNRFLCFTTGIPAKATATMFITLLKRRAAGKSGRKSRKPIRAVIAFAITI